MKNNPHWTREQMAMLNVYAGQSNLTPERNLSGAWKAVMSSCSPVQRKTKVRGTSRFPATKFPQSLITRRFNWCWDVLITRGIHDLFQIDDVSRIVSLSRDTIQASSCPNLPESVLNHHHALPTQAVTNGCCALVCAFCEFGSITRTCFRGTLASTQT